MKHRIRIIILCGMLIACLTLCGCGGIRDHKPSGSSTVNPAGQTVIDQTSPVIPSPTPTPVPVTTPSVAVTPVPLQTPVPGAAAAPTSSPVPTAVPAHTPVPTAAPVSTPIPTAAPSSSGLPVVTKSPTSETVAPGGSCWFVAKYRDAVYAEWHFVSPDGSRDLDYSQAAKEFSGLEIVDGYASSMQLKNIPASLNGWKVYCRFSNKAGAVKTDKASITVTGSQQNQASGVPLITKNPTGETVAPGGACSFVARYKDAIWAEWHFVSPDGRRDLNYTQAAAEFHGLTMTGGNSSVLKLSTIPSSLNGWSVYCRFTNNNGGANTTRAGITVTGSQATIIPDTSGAVVPGGSGSPDPGGSGTVVPGGPGSSDPVGPGTVVPGGPGSTDPVGPGTVVPGGPGSPDPSGSGTVVPGGPGSPDPSGSGTVVPGDPGDPGVIIIG